MPLVTMYSALRLGNALLKVSVLRLMPRLKAFHLSSRALIVTTVWRMFEEAIVTTAKNTFNKLESFFNFLGFNSENFNSDLMWIYI